MTFKKLQKEEEKLQKAAAAVERQRLVVEAKPAKAAESQCKGLGVRLFWSYGG